MWKYVIELAATSRMACFCAGWYNHCNKWKVMGQTGSPMMLCFPGTDKPSVHTAGNTGREKCTAICPTPGKNGSHGLGPQVSQHTPLCCCLEPRAYSWGGDLSINLSQQQTDSPYTHTSGLQIHCISVYTHRFLFKICKYTTTCHNITAVLAHYMLSKFTNPFCFPDLNRTVVPPWT